MWNVPSHITSGIVTMVGDVTSLARFQQTCVMAQAMILDPTTWSERNPGVICSRAIEEDWFRRGSHLALALRASRFMALQWPLTHSTMLIAETTMVLWRSKGTVLAPLMFDLNGEDLPERCLFTVGTSTNSERCWCELNNLQSGAILSSMSHSRSREAARTRAYVMPRSPMQNTRRFQVQWWQDTLQVCMDGHHLGSLQLEPNQIPHKARIAIYVFRSGHGGLSTNQCRSCVLPTELGTSWVYEHLADQREPLDRQDDLRAGGLDVSSLMLLQCFFLESLRDFMALESCNSTPWQSIQNSQFWREVDLHLTQHLSVDLRGGALNLMSVTPFPVAWLEGLEEFLCLASCNAELTELIQRSSFWHGVDLKLKGRLLVSFRRSAFFGSLLEAWEQGIRTVSCPRTLLHIVSSLGEKVRLQGNGEYLPCMLGPRGSPPASTRIMYWKMEQETCYQTSMRVRLPSDTTFLVLALRRADYRNTPESSACMVFRRPFTTVGQVQFRLSNGNRVVIPMPMQLKEGGNSSHTFAFHWDSNFLEFSVDGRSIATILLTAEQRIEPWVRSAAMCLAPFTNFVESFQVEALPFKYMTSFGYPTCAYCSSESLGCCSECEHWFCQRHGVASADVCLACVPEYYLEDRLGGSSVQVTPSVRLQIEKRRLQALRKQYLCFQGDQVKFQHLCQRMLAVEDVLHFDFPSVQLSIEGSEATPGVPLMQRIHEARDQMEESVFFSVTVQMDRPSGTCSLYDFELDACLPRSVRQWTGSRSICVASPSSFNVERLEGLAILDILSIVHPHPRDACLQFRDLDHSYTWRGCKVSLSVTGLIHKLAQSFNAMEALRAMRGGRNWPRVDYLATNAVSELRRVLRTEGPVEMQLQQLLESSEIDLEAVCSRLRDLMWTHPGYRHLAEIVTLSDAQIMSMWEENRRTAASRGTWTHALCECLLNGGSVPVDSAEICMFFKFLRVFQSEGWTIHRTEWTVYAEAEDLAGSIDAVAQRGSEICLLDWKRTKQLASKDCSFGRRLHFPLEDTEDSVLWHYRIQLNIYAWILRHYYDMTATDLRIVCLHPDNNFKPLVITVPVMSDRVDKLMSWRRDDLPSKIFVGVEARHQVPQLFRRGSIRNWMMPWTSPSSRNNRLLLSFQMPRSQGSLWIKTLLRGSWIQR